LWRRIAEWCSLGDGRQDGPVEIVDARSSFHQRGGNSAVRIEHHLDAQLTDA
jgi:hypothetical protein